MKKQIFLIFHLLIANVCFCQSIYPYQNIDLNKPSDYKESEPFALSAASFILSTPFKKGDMNRAHAIQFLTKWMSGTKEYNFNFQGTVQDISDDPDLLELFVAGMVKFALENKGLSGSPRVVEISASKLVLAYCDNPANNFKIKKKMRKKLETN